VALCMALFLEGRFVVGCGARGRGACLMPGTPVHVGGARA